MLEAIQMHISSLTGYDWSWVGVITQYGVI